MRMSEAPAAMADGAPRPAGAPIAAGPPRIPVFALGLALSLFFAITFLLCVGFDLLFPSLAMNPIWSQMLPGFVWLTWGGFLIGLVESAAYGWYVALIFAPLFNLFARRLAPRG